MKITSSVFSDKFELCNAKGEVVKEVPFTINLTNTAQTVLQKRQDLDAVNPDDVGAMGKAFQDLLIIIFGKEVTDELVDFFQNDYLAMITELAPVLTDHIFPVFHKYRKSALDAKKKVKK